MPSFSVISLCINIDLYCKLIMKTHSGALKGHSYAENKVSDCWIRLSFAPTSNICVIYRCSILISWERHLQLSNFISLIKINFFLLSPSRPKSTDMCPALNADTQAPHQTTAALCTASLKTEILPGWSFKWLFKKK